MESRRSATAALVLVTCCALLAPTGSVASSHSAAHRSGIEEAHRQRDKGANAPRKARRRGARKRHAKPTAPPAPSAPSVPSVPSVPSPPVVPPPAQSTPPSAPEGAGSVIFESGFDGSFAGWYVQSLSYRATIDTANPEMGSGAGRFEVQPGDREPDTGGQRSEVVGPTFKEGQNVFIRDDIRIPAGYSYQGPWQLIDQLHETNWGGSPGTATFLDPNRNISFDTGTNSIRFWQGPQLELERWYDLVFRVNLSQNPSEGYVEVWWDGVQQTLSNGRTRMYAKTIQMPETYLKAGVFRSLESTGVSVVEHDNIVVGTTLASVMDN